MWTRRKRLKKSSVRLARLSHVARGRHHAVGRREDARRAREDRMSRTRVSAPRIDANGVVVGIPVAAI